MSAGTWQAIIAALALVSAYLAYAAWCAVLGLLRESCDLSALSVRWRRRPGLRWLARRCAALVPGPSWAVRRRGWLVVPHVVLRWKSIPFHTVGVVIGQSRRQSFLGPALVVLTPLLVLSITFQFDDGGWRPIRPRAQPAGRVPPSRVGLVDQREPRHASYRAGGNRHAERAGARARRSAR